MSDLISLHSCHGLRLARSQVPQFDVEIGLISAGYHQAWMLLTHPKHADRDFVDACHGLIWQVLENQLRRVC